MTGRSSAHRADARCSQNPEFFVGLVFAGRQAVVAIDADSKGLLGIKIDHGRLVPLVSPDNGRRRLTEGKPNDVLCRVRRRRIEVLCNGQLAIWAVDAEQLPHAEVWTGTEIVGPNVPPVNAIQDVTWWKSGDEPKPFVGGANPHRIHRITLTQVIWSPTRPVLAKVPDPSQTAAAQKKIVEQFAQEWAAAQEEEKRRLVLLKMCEIGTQPFDSVSRFAVFQEVWQRAARHGDVRMCCEAIDQARLNFAIDASRAKLNGITSLLPEVPEPLKTEYRLQAKYWYQRGLAARSSQDERLATQLEKGISSLPQDSRPCRLRPGLIADIYADLDFQRHLERHIRPRADAIWNGRSRDNSLLPADRFSIRWTGWLIPPLPGDYNICPMTVGKGCRLWLDGVLLIDENRKELPWERSEIVPLTDAPHRIVVEHDDQSPVRLTWWFHPRSHHVTIPPEALFHDPADLEQQWPRSTPPQK